MGPLKKMLTLAILATALIGCGSDDENQNNISLPLNRQLVNQSTGQSLLFSNQNQVLFNNGFFGTYSGNSISSSQGNYLVSVINSNNNFNNQQFNNSFNNQQFNNGFNNQQFNNGFNNQVSSNVCVTVSFSGNTNINNNFVNTGVNNNFVNTSFNNQQFINGSPTNFGFQPFPTTNNFVNNQQFNTGLTNNFGNISGTYCSLF